MVLKKAGVSQQTQQEGSFLNQKGPQPIEVDSRTVSFTPNSASIFEGFLEFPWAPVHGHIKMLSDLVLPLETGQNIPQEPGTDLTEERSHHYVQLLQPLPLRAALYDTLNHNHDQKHLNRKKSYVPPEIDPYVMRITEY